MADICDIDAIACFGNGRINGVCSMVSKGVLLGSHCRTGNLFGAGKVINL